VQNKKLKKVRKFCKEGNEFKYKIQKSKNPEGGLFSDNIFEFNE
jgi:hypothetical protein